MRGRTVAGRSGSAEFAKMAVKSWWDGEPVLTFNSAFFVPPVLVRDDQQSAGSARAPVPTAEAPVASDESENQDLQVAWKLKSQIREIDFLIATMEKSNEQAEKLITEYRNLLTSSGNQLDKTVSRVTSDWRFLANALTDELDTGCL
jgi:hypothetical protein